MSMYYFINGAAGKIFGGRKFVKGEHSSRLRLCISLLIERREKFWRAKIYSAQGIFSFAQGERISVKNGGENSWG